MIAAADGHNDVLLSLVHVGHGAACSTRVQLRLPDYLAGSLVVRAELLAPLTLRSANDRVTPFPQEQE